MQSLPIANRGDRNYEVQETGEVAMSGYPEAMDQGFHAEDISKYSKFFTSLLTLL